MKTSKLTWSQYIRYGLGRRISLIGQRLGADPLIYNPLVMLKFHEDAHRDAPKVVPAVISTFPDAKSFFDVGCGSGVFAAELQTHNRRVVACERSRVGRWLAVRQGVDCRDFDLTRPAPCNVTGRFDVVSCFEVAEHLPIELGDKLVRFICDHAAHVIFTAAHPGQGGTGHINEQPQQYWIDRFRSHDFNYLQSTSESLSEKFRRADASHYFAANVCVFSHAERNS